MIAAALGWLSGLKGWLYAALAAAVIGAGLWVYWHGRAVGDERGAARVQRAWDKNLADIAALAAKAEAGNAARLQEAEDRNRSIVDDYEKRIADSDARGADLARRLRDATLAARRRDMPQACNQPGTAPASGEPSREAIIDGRIAAYDAACQRDAARLNAVLKELMPQL